VIQAIGEITGIPWRDHVEYVSDRIRGDRRYALDRTKTKAETGWEAYTAFENGLDKTVKWYRDMYVDGKRR
jgi:dTDP-glucose 4,6-dehydratase